MLELNFEYDRLFYFITLSDTVSTMLLELPKSLPVFSPVEQGMAKHLTKVLKPLKQ